MQRKLLMSTSIGGNREDYNPFYATFWLVERETIESKDFEECDSADEDNFPEEKSFIDKLRTLGYSVTELASPGCLLMED